MTPDEQIAPVDSIRSAADVSTVETSVVFFSRDYRPVFVCSRETVGLDCCLVNQCVL